jgi:hypothetical protein
MMTYQIVITQTYILTVTVDVDSADYAIENDIW